MILYLNDDLTEMSVDAIVNAANTSLVGGEGLCGMVHAGAGPGIDLECRAIGYCLRGEAVITGGYNLPAKYVIHTVGPVYGQHHGAEPEILYSCYYESMKLANEYKLKSIAFPYISTGIYRYPKNKARPIAVKALIDFFDDNSKTTLTDVYLVDYSDDTP